MPKHLAWLIAAACIGSLSWKADCFHCFKCDNLTVEEDCSLVTQCATNERCYVERHGHGNATRFNLGCIDSQRCQSHKEFTIVGRSTNDRCLECCARDGCNKELCAIKAMPAVQHQGVCADDPFTNCSRMAKLVNICSDVHQAKQVCRKSCGLCALVDGGWTAWGNWTSCSTSCGVGYKSRSRTCTNPAPQHGGDMCPGNATQIHSCFDRDCPVHGEWSSWNSWEDCSVPCGLGVAKRHRTCTNPTPSLYGRYCLGDAVDFDICTVNLCGNTTGKVNTTKTPQCHDVLNDCDVANKTTGICRSSLYARQMCAKFCGLCSIVDGKWADWSSWSKCSTSCGNGTWTRKRTCSDPPPAKGGKPCPGVSAETGQCNLRQCPVHGNWTPWGKWSTCSASCGQGLTHRRRTCTNPRPSYNGNYCFDDPTEYAQCMVKQCPVDGGWGGWSLWSSCSVTCGPGQNTRQRSCTSPSPANGGRNCTGISLDHETCHAMVCPVNGGWSLWSSWSTCSTSCNGGEKRRHRSCSNPAPVGTGRQCSGNSDDTTECNTQRCTGPVVFSAHGVQNAHPSYGQRLIFAQVRYNIGNGYNVTSGIFTAPEAGLYLFSLQICVYGMNGGISYMVVDTSSNVILRVYSSQHDYYNTASNSVPVYLRRGQKVWVVDKFGSGNYYYDDINCGTQFSGSLVDHD